MKKRNRVMMILGVLCALVLAGGAVNYSVASIPNAQAVPQTNEIRHALVTLPWYGVFDNIAFRVDGSGQVTLTGQVTQPVVKYDAAAAVKGVKGVETVKNEIKVLPPSRFDDFIRLRTYRAIFSRPGFEKYAVQAVPPIRIIVDNGHVTLDGVVGSPLDREMADMAARSVPGVFSVTNNLKIG